MNTHPSNPLAAALTVKVHSHSEANKSYTVTFPVNAEPYCECKGYGYRRTCSHIKQAADILLAEFVKQQHEAAASLNPVPIQLNYCTSCGAPLSGTHALLHTCAACYRQQILPRVPATTATTATTADVPVPLPAEALPS